MYAVLWIYDTIHAVYIITCIIDCIHVQRLQWPRWHGWQWCILKSCTNCYYVLTVICTSIEFHWITLPTQYAHRKLRGSLKHCYLYVMSEICLLFHLELDDSCFLWEILISVCNIELLKFLKRSFSLVFELKFMPAPRRSVWYIVTSCQF